MYEPAASDSPSGPPSSPISASASASTCGRPMTRAIAASCSAAVAGTGLRAEVADELGDAQPRVEVGVGLDASASTGRRGTAADRWRPSRSPRCRPAGGRRRSVAWGTSVAHGVEHRRLERADVGQQRARREVRRQRRAARRAPAAAAWRARPGRRRARRPRRSARPGSRTRWPRRPWSRVDVVADDLEAAVAHGAASSSRRSGRGRARRRGAKRAVIAVRNAGRRRASRR